VNKQSSNPQPDAGKIQELTGSSIDKVFNTDLSKQGDSRESEDVAMIIREWLDKRHLRTKTRYTKRQVLAVTTLQSLADTYKIKTLDRFLKEFRTSKLSEEGKSSSELENILKARLPAEEDIELRKLSKFLD
jgi:uncharacterized Rmd1/YagE family protein